MAVIERKFVSTKGEGTNFQVQVSGVDDYKRVLGKLRQKRKLSSISRKSLGASAPSTVANIKASMVFGKSSTGALKKSMGFKTKAYPRSGNAVVMYGAIARKRFTGRTQSGRQIKKWSGGWQPKSRGADIQGGYYKKKELEDGFTVEGVKNNSKNISSTYAKVFQREYLMWQKQVTNKAMIARAKRAQKRVRR